MTKNLWASESKTTIRQALQSMNSLKRMTLVACAVLPLLVAAVIFFRSSAEQPLSPREILRLGSPENAARIEPVIEMLKREPLEESIKKLLDVNMYYSPGPTIPGIFVGVDKVPMPKNATQLDVEAIMSNRRFRKVLAELSQLDKTVASEFIRRELSGTMEEYLLLYDAEMARFAPYYTPEYVADKAYIVGPVFSVDNVPDGEFTIAGARLKILALIWIAGILELPIQNQVYEVALVAQRQRNELYTNPDVISLFKSAMLRSASLYNRQIIASAVLGTNEKREKAASILEVLGLEWEEKTLVPHAAAVTEYDLPVRSRFMRPDETEGHVNIRILGPVTCDEFDDVLGTLEFR